ncbi:DUF1883 domain-containing protein [Serratia sp. AKBS12]|uniref:DUF1883 domain-containing protein n=1 Tax=Serratia sp. AKBS12 TaxID=2974597 RepID=UPI002165BCA8|nr:DUF1883 domain-containing protein [Serratia sp. AKBS12]MCS3408328.1 DUF1883 domain-containing protein [Serratia sp. AKBS12]HEI8864666.1 DUF1883 domain-containing protein [Serratia odorifera]
MDNHFFIQRRVILNAGDVICIHCSHPVVILLRRNRREYKTYAVGQEGRFNHGCFTHFPVNLRIPQAGVWDILLEPMPVYRERFKYALNFIGHQELSAPALLKKNLMLVDVCD